MEFVNYNNIPIRVTFTLSQYKSIFKDSQCMSLYSDIIQDFTRSTNKSVLNAAWLLKNIAPGIILTNIDKAVRKKACCNS